MANHIHQKTKIKNLCVGDGVVLNGVANYKLLKASELILKDRRHLDNNPILVTKEDIKKY